MESVPEDGEVVERTEVTTETVTEEVPEFSDRPEGEVSTTVVTETTENPSTSAQEVVDEVHETQEENSTVEEDD